MNSAESKDVNETVRAGMGKSGQSWWIELLLLGLVIAIPMIGLSLIPTGVEAEKVEMIVGGDAYPPSPIAFERSTIGAVPNVPARITNVQIVDFDDDGRNDVLCCDALRNEVILYRQTEPLKWDEEVLGRDLVAPAHATPADLDQDGDRDVIVSVLGDTRPNDDLVGRLVWLEQTDDGFVPHLILRDVRRVADAQAADLDGDGDIDIAVAVFGYARGKILWMENRGDGKFSQHDLMYAPGTIHVPIGDFDGDGDPDIAAIVSQNEEEVWAFVNDGQGHFESKRLWFTVNYDIGSAGLVSGDLDQDGDLDLLLPVGDNLEYEHTYPQPYHGCLWFENLGQWQFEPRWIGTLGGTYAAGLGDVDGDGDQDVVLTSMFNNWRRNDTASAVWLENDGEQNFTPWEVATSPIRLATVACGDLNGDGSDDIVAGGLHFREAGDRMQRVTAWTSKSGGVE